MADIKEEKENCDINNIKSPYILQIILSYLKEKQNLSLINYNRELQKKLSIKIEDYMKASGKIKIIEKNGKGKEYSLDSNIIRFEGEYSNRKRTRLGKEFDNNGKLEFEGNYWNGKRHGKGKEYHYIYYDFSGGSGDKYEEMFFNGQESDDKEKENYYFYDVVKVFEGEYLNGKRNGKGKEYSSRYRNYGYLIFEGDYLNGKRHGKGKEYEYGNLIFEGEYLNGERNGKGKEYDKRKLKYEGEYLNGKIWNGKGYNEDGKLEYEIKNGKGFIIEYNEWDKIFEGEYLNGIRNGKGKEYNIN